MVSLSNSRCLRWLVACLTLVSMPGCTGIRAYFQNSCKVGPNFCQPSAPAANSWIDAADKHVRTDSDDLAGWWTVFGDPLLNCLVDKAYHQNLTLREAGYRVLAARAQLGIARGDIFPQGQNAIGSYRRIGAGNNFFDQWNFSFNLAWELDFWGRFRRAILAAEDTLNASVFDYDAAVVTLVSDTAADYVTVRTTQERIRLLDVVIHVQEDVLAFIEERVKLGKGATDIDLAQARSNLEQSRAQRDQFVADLRTAENQLCILLGIPAVDLTNILASAANTDIPIAPEYVVVGMPAELLSRRPDVRRAEFAAAAQAEQIGIAAADWYPAITINGTLGWQAQHLSQLFRPSSLNSSVGPSFQWDLLNYGRIKNNVRLQDATFNELIATYQETVLEGDLEVENGIVTFVQAHQRSRDLRKSVDQAWLALEVLVAQYRAGLSGIDFNRYATIQQTLVTQQDLWAQSRGQIDLGLIAVYRGLGGGWQIKCDQVPDKRGVLSPSPGDANANASGNVGDLPAPADSAAPANPATSPVPPTNPTTSPPIPPQANPPQAIPTPPATPSSPDASPAGTPGPAAKEPGPDLLPPPQQPKS
ncbi:MAG TPA: TolC family protein [Lacipirellulaceae bacterium]|nr:TolC family protein [Lacipirellulaceae bacterium]